MAKPRLSIEIFREIVKKKGGYCLSNKYINSKTKLTFKCQKGHIWKALPHSILSGSWCGTCYNDAITEKQKENLKYFIEIAKERGGKCLSNKFINYYTKLQFRCNNGHKFEMKPTHVKSGSWCPYCKISIRENLVRKIFEEIFEKEFPNVSNLTWLISINGNRLQLDGYNEELNLAFEVQGIQHYVFNKFFHRTIKNFQRIQDDDKQKVILCKTQNVVLIIVPYYIPEKNLVKHIIEKCKETGFIIPDSKFNINIDDLNVYSQGKLERFKELAEERGVNAFPQYILMPKQK